MLPLWINSVFNLSMVTVVICKNVTWYIYIYIYISQILNFDEISGICQREPIQDMSVCLCVKSDVRGYHIYKLD